MRHREYARDREARQGNRPVLQPKAPPQPSPVQARPTQEVLQARLRRAELLGHRPSALGPMPVHRAPVRPALELTSASIQRVPWWKKALTVAGAGAAGAALWSSAPLWVPLVAGGTSVLAGLSWYKEKQQEDREDFVESARAGLVSDAERLNPATEREQALAKVFQEVLAQLDKVESFSPVTSGVSQISHARNAEQPENRRYNIPVNTEDPTGVSKKKLAADPALLAKTVILHELTHLSADQNYTSNRGEKNFFPTTWHEGEKDQRTGFIADSLGGALDILDKDELIPKREREYIEDRLMYIGQTERNPEIEYDTVLNELLYYFHLRNIPEESPTSKKIVALAMEAQEYRLRNKNN